MPYEMAFSISEYQYGKFKKISYKTGMILLTTKKYGVIIKIHRELVSHNSFFIMKEISL